MWAFAAYSGGLLGGPSPPNDWHLTPLADCWLAGWHTPTSGRAGGWACGRTRRRVQLPSPLAGTIGLHLNPTLLSFLNTPGYPNTFKSTPKTTLKRAPRPLCQRRRSAHQKEQKKQQSWRSEYASAGLRAANQIANKEAFERSRATPSQQASSHAELASSVQRAPRTATTSPLVLSWRAGISELHRKPWRGYGLGRENSPPCVSGERRVNIPSQNENGLEISGDLIESNWDQVVDK